jgi:hypothetical protein
MVSAAAMDHWRWGLSDEYIEMLREFRETTGRQHSVHSSTFLEFIGPDTIPEEHHVIEFLWAYAPLYYGSRTEPLDDFRDEIAALIRFMAPRHNWQPEGCLAVCADSETFQHRWRSLYRTPLPLWLEELRSMLKLRGLPSTIPPADPADPFGHSLVARIQPGLHPLLTGPAPETEPSSAMQEEGAKSPALAYISSLITAVGPGTKLTAKGHLSLAAGRALAEAIGCGDLFDERIGDRVFKTRSSSEIEPLELVFRWARGAGLLRTEHGKVVPTRKGRRFGEHPLDDWWSLFRTAVLKLNWVKQRYPRDRKPFWAELVNECVPAYLRIAVDAGPRGVAILPLAQITWRLVQERWVTEDLSDDQVRWQQSSISSAIRRGFFLPLELLGCAKTWIGPAHGAVKMAPLGIWGVNRLSGELNVPLTPEYGPSAQGVVNLSEWRVRRE